MCLLFVKQVVQEHRLRHTVLDGIAEVRQVLQGQGQELFQVRQVQVHSQVLQGQAVQAQVQEALAQERVPYPLQEQDYRRHQPWAELWVLQIQIMGKLWLAQRIAVVHSGISVPIELDIDHINRDKLDNRLSNLRLATPSQNAANCDKVKGATSKFMGVSWNTAAKKWHAAIRVDFKPKHLGSFSCQYLAATAYNVAAIKYFGKFANLNLIPTGYVL